MRGVIVIVVDIISVLLPFMAAAWLYHYINTFTI